MHVRLQEGHPNHFRVLNSLTMVRRLRSSECSELTQSTQSLLEESPRDSKFLICRWCPFDIHPSAEAGKGSSGTSNYSSCSIDTFEVVWQHRWWKSSPKKDDHEKMTNVHCSPVVQRFWSPNVWCPRSQRCPASFTPTRLIWWVSVALLWKLTEGSCSKGASQQLGGDFHGRIWCDPLPKSQLQWIRMDRYS